MNFKRHLERHLGSKLLLAAAWALLAIWAVSLALWWTWPSRPAQPQIVQARPTPLPTATRPPATLAPGVSPTSTPRPTPVLREVERVPGPLVVSRDFLALSRAFDVELAFEHIQALADPQMAGRKPGYPTNTASDYVAQQFAAYGLQPAGVDGTYFQPFPMPYLELTELPSLTIISPDGQGKDGYRFRADFNDRSRNYTGAGQAEGQVLWVNYGAYHDYDQADAVGKIVLMREGTREDIYRNAVEHGAAGMLIIADDPSRLKMRFYYRAPWIPETIPAFLISNQVAEDALFAGDAGLRAFLDQPTRSLTGTVGILDVGGIGAGEGFYLIGEGGRDRDAALVHHLTNSAEVLGRRFSFESAKASAGEGLPWVWLHWDGSEALAGYPEDNADALDERKLRSAGETISLAAMMLARN